MYSAVSSDKILDTICPLDGRDRLQCGDLASHMSERAYIYNRLKVELVFLNRISKILLGDDDYIEVEIPKFITESDFNRIKEIEKITNHDLNAITTFIKESLMQKYSHITKKQLSLIHIGLTSQDANSLGFMIGFQNGMFSVISNIDKFLQESKSLVDRTDITIMSRTHGQPAPATNLSKELYVRHQPIQIKLNKLLQHVSKNLTVKFGGAVGNMNAFKVISNKINWLEFADDFVESFGFKRSQFTTQIDDYTSVTESLDMISDIANYLESYAGNLWLYISDSYLLQKAIKTEVGSSTMPQKVNPIGLEKAESCFQVCISLINSLKRILLVNATRYQRTIADSYATRTIPVVLGYFVVGTKSMTDGIKRLIPNTEYISKDLHDHPEIIMEGIQTGMRLDGIDEAYELAKNFSRTTEQNITLDQIREFVQEQNISDPQIKDKLMSLTPETYTGIFPNF